MLMLMFKEKEINIKEQVESVYSLYPTKCPINSNSTGKSKTNKDKIKTLLKEHSEDHLKIHHQQIQR